MLNIEYIFPLWFLMMLISITIQAPKLSNLTLNIRAARICPDSALLFRFAMEGNADGIRDLFDKGLASPFDVDASTRTSALVYATGWHHPKVWKLLLEAGADPYQESNTRHSPMVNVWRSLLEAGFVQKTLGKPTEKKAREDDNSNMPEDILMALKGDFDLEEYMERRQFPILHQIVMGLVDADLEAQLRVSTAEIDSVDQQGLTALSWAATTGDIDSVETLLRHSANPNLVAFNGDTALHYAVRTVNPGCIEPLIRYKADVDAQNAWAVTPLHYATMNRDDLQHVIPLVESNAKVDLVDQHGRTPLFRAVKYNRPKIVRYLLEHKAQLLIDRWGQHPLDQALDSGFHEVLETVLAQRGHQFTKDQITVSLSRAEELEDQYAIGLLEEKLLEISQRSFAVEDSFVFTKCNIMEEKLVV
jgi:ankyrin repeat protein